jgi:hypothetical protein
MKSRGRTIECWVYIEMLDSLAAFSNSRLTFDFSNA